MTPLTPHPTTSAPSAGPVDVQSMVGHLLRRCHQVHHAVWTQTVGEVLTSPQFSALEVVAAAGEAGVDQSTVGDQAALDRSTVGGVVQRLEDQQWITRAPDLADARRRLLRITPPAHYALQALTLRVDLVQERLMRHLEDSERSALVRLLGQMSELAQTPSAGGFTPGHLIRRAQQRHNQLWVEEQQGVLTGPQFAVLGLLCEKGRFRQGTLAAEAALDRSSASDVLARLQRRGLTRRTTAPDDARSLQVELTEAGRSAVLAAAPAAQRVQQRLLAPLAPPDRTLVTRLLGAVARRGERPSSGQA